MRHMAKRHKTIAALNLELKEMYPLTINQELAFRSSKNMVLYGSAGSGKSFISIYKAFKAINYGAYNNLVIIRSAVPSRDMGFLPGTEKEKSAVYEEPYKDIAIELFGRGDAYAILKQKDMIQFMTTSFLRGMTLRDSVIVVDECQNMTFAELDTIITRLGSNSLIYFCGDFNQTDLNKNGMREFLHILNATQLFDFIEFDIEDIVRSGLVKQYLIAKDFYSNNEGSSQQQNLPRGYA